MVAPVRRPLPRKVRTAAPVRRPLPRKVQTVIPIRRPLPRKLRTVAPVRRPLPRKVQTVTPIRRPLPRKVQTVAPVRKPLPRKVRTRRAGAQLNPASRPTPAWTPTPAAVLPDRISSTRADVPVDDGSRHATEACDQPPRESSRARRVAVGVNSASHANRCTPTKTASARRPGGRSREIHFTPEPLAARVSVRRREKNFTPSSARTKKSMSSVDAIRPTLLHGRHSMLCTSDASASRDSARSSRGGRRGAVPDGVPLLVDPTRYRSGIVCSLASTSSQVQGAVA
jgi:hypothetical protein